MGPCERRQEAWRRKTGVLGFGKDVPNPKRDARYSNKLRDLSLVQVKTEQ
jgi:hypothetical protein